MLPFVIKYKLKSRIFYTHSAHTLIPMENPCADIMSYYKKKNPPAAGYSILQPNGFDRVTITVLRPRDTTYAQRVLSGRLQSMRARAARTYVTAKAP